MKKLFITSILLLCCTSGFAATSKTLAQLYDSYEQNDQMTSEMDEYQQSIQFKAIVESVDQGVTSQLVLTVSDPTNRDAVARLTPLNGGEQQKMAKLAAGSNAEFTCTLKFAMGSEYLPFENCSVK